MERKRPLVILQAFREHFAEVFARYELHHQRLLAVEVEIIDHARQRVVAQAAKQSGLALEGFAQTFSLAAQSRPFQIGKLLAHEGFVVEARLLDDYRVLQIQIGRLINQSHPALPAEQAKNFVAVVENRSCRCHRGRTSIYLHSGSWLRRECDLIKTARAVGGTLAPFSISRSPRLWPLLRLGVARCDQFPQRRIDSRGVREYSGNVRFQTYEHAPILNALRAICFAKGSVVILRSQVIFRIELLVINNLVCMWHNLEPLCASLLARL